VKPAIIFS